MTEFQRRIKHWPTTLFGLIAIVGGGVLFLIGKIDGSTFTIVGLAGLGALGYGPKIANSKGSE